MIRKLIVAAFALSLVGAAVNLPGSAKAAQEPGAESIWDALIGGDPYLDMRARMEIANLTGLTQSEAYTLRTRLGYGTKPFHGFSAYADFENIATPAQDTYFNVVETPTGQTPIADPTVTELNQAYLKIARKDLLDSTLVGGRQRITLDDHRFVGNVGWRQNEQTYDSASLKSSFNVDGLETYYAYLWDIRRIFGNQGPPGTLNFDSNSHLLHASFAGFEPLKATVFVYLLDFSNSAVNSSASYGFRLNGGLNLSDDWKIGYQGSYAYQTDYGINPVSYGSNYVMVDGDVGWTKAGNLGLGFEMLGSDAGKAGFVTPLATLHKFNGWADVFLDNGGPAGLRDFYVYLAPKLPWKLAGKLVYHHFRDDATDSALGNEIDAVLSRPISKYLTVLTKVAYFNATDGSPRPGEVIRWWLDFTLKF